MTEGFTAAQLDIISRPTSEKIFLEGPPGCGKTSAAAARLQQLLLSGIPGQEILVVTPQRTLAQPYMSALQSPDLPAGGQVTVVTIGGLAQRVVQWFWPLAAHSAGFLHPESTPVFLTLETAQYFMAQVAEPFFEEGFFESLTVDHNRILAQILDNLNKAAVVGFDHRYLSEKLKNAWVGQSSQLIVYDQVQTVANAFRQYCLENNMLDFSLQFEIFAQQLWPQPAVRAYLHSTYHHLIYDNIEEDIPVAHDLIAEMLPEMQSALLIYDQGGGNRVFLGADPDYAYGLKAQCESTVSWDESFVLNQNLAHFEDVLHQSLSGSIEQLDPELLDNAYTHLSARFFTDMVEQVAGQIQNLVEAQGVPAAEIAVLTPYLSDSLRYALAHRLNQVGIAARSLRPSRSLFSEPSARCLITLARLAHPQWSGLPTQADFRTMLLQVIGGIDLVRADLFSRILYRPNKPDAPLFNFDEVEPGQQERMTFSFGQRYTELRNWLTVYQDQPETDELDVFLSRLFGELISQPGFGFHEDFEAAGITAQLIESVQKFRRVTDASLSGAAETGAAYLRTVRDGVIAAQYLLPYQQNADAVLLAPAYTFLMANQPVHVQFWLDAGSEGWWQRLYQPLTHPYVLSREWDPQAQWTDVEEFAANQRALQRLTYGLVNRCSGHIFICTNSINERGSEERGPLLRSLQMILKKRNSGETDHVYTTR